VAICKSCSFCFKCRTNWTTLENRALWPRWLATVECPLRSEVRVFFFSAEVGGRWLELERNTKQAVPWERVSG